jgi:hypothetical protein
MSARFAIPATTSVLRGLVQERLAHEYGALTAPTVSVEPLPRPAPTATNAAGAAQQTEPTRLHLICHHVAPNPGLRNTFEPHVSTQGIRADRSPLAVDLHYLLAATGPDLEREVLLSLGVIALHRFGIVPRDKIEAILTATAVPQSPTKITDLVHSERLFDPAEQPEQITITQQQVDLDLSTRIWSAFQSPMRPSAYFLVTTVFLEVDETLPAPATVTAVAVGVRPDVGRGVPHADDVMRTP